MKSQIFFLRFLLFITFTLIIVSTSTAENVKKSVEDNRDDNGETNEETKDESLDIPVEHEPTNITCTRRQGGKMHEIRNANAKEFPFMAALMSQQNDFLCSGSVVSNGLILTTAHCTEQPLSYVLLNATKDKRDETTAALHVIKTEKFPTYTGGDSVKDVALIYTEKHNSSIASKIRISNISKPNDISDVEVLGFGLNADVGQTKDLQYVGLEKRYQYEYREYTRGDILSTYIDCIDTKVLTCFKDSGGPVIFDNELVGIVIKGQEECSREMTSKFAGNKKMADILPAYSFKAWLDEKIKKNEEVQPVALVSYPSDPVRMRHKHKMTSSYSSRAFSIPINIYNIASMCLIVLIFH
ncbi:hypothetical protein K1T71_003122 [Dendrolimus kikuchii]|uniref:Uncharacterized protein n=1 Tax=Dendrolimus kikuchii TaxID=765133 RepID=A0ACC1DAZ1_9NEOP|nr:hypothetical protein K1T71_003122 [Dendrolimus kikuchii]